MMYKSWIKPTSLKVSQSFGDGHWEMFQASRKDHNENLCTETNKLVLRLDKLLNPQNDHKLDLDESIVEWTPDNLVKMCPFCAKMFTFARRRHHCRACGAILCNNCSSFLEYEAACKLIKPMKLYLDPYDRIEDRLQNKSTEEMPKIRTCEDCRRLLDKRIQTIEDHYCQPTFLDFYQKLRETMCEADELILSHSALVEDRKQPTQELKDKIQTLRHSIASMSAKLTKMAGRESGKQAYLLETINQSVGYWLKESIESKSARVHGLRVGTPSGWVPEQRMGSLDLDGEEDPLRIQIKNLEEYIKQARLAGRYEEVSALEESKRDLEIECLVQQDLKI